MYLYFYVNEQLPIMQWTLCDVEIKTRLSLRKHFASCWWFPGLMEAVLTEWAVTTPTAPRSCRNGLRGGISCDRSWPKPGKTCSSCLTKLTLESSTFYFRTDLGLLLFIIFVTAKRALKFNMVLWIWTQSFRWNGSGCTVNQKSHYRGVKVMCHTLFLLPKLNIGIVFNNMSWLLCISVLSSACCISAVIRASPSQFTGTGRVFNTQRLWYHEHFHVRAQSVLVQIRLTNLHTLIFWVRCVLNNHKRVLPKYHIYCDNLFSFLFN